MELCTRRGQDFRELTLVAGGGAGPIHGPFIAELLGIQTVVIPSVAALYSAFGMFTMDLGRDFARSHVIRADLAHPGTIEDLYRELEGDAQEAIGRMAVADSAPIFARSVEMRYVGQFHEVEVEFPSGHVTAEDIKDTIARFHAQHENLYTFSMPWRETEFLTFRLRATVPRAQFKLQQIAIGGHDPHNALRRKRKCIWDGKAVETPVYSGGLMRAGYRIIGPAIIEEQTTTVVIPQQFTCEVDSTRSFQLHRQPN
jgi:N-methylhydantoinase A